MVRILFYLGLAALLIEILPLASAQEGASPPQQVTIVDNGSSLSIRHNGKDFATYYYRHKTIPRPFFADLQSPSGVKATRNFPPVKGEDLMDHPTMHPGVWMAFGDISGSDFWRNKARVSHEGFPTKPAGGAGLARFTQRKAYRDANGAMLGRETFRCEIHFLSIGAVIVWDSEFQAVNGQAFVFGDQEEMGLGIRVASAIAEKNGGRILDSKGRSTARNVWSQASQWCDYSGMKDGNRIGMTILCHPKNFRESWMHARDYGLIVANPFGRKAMGKGERSQIPATSERPIRLRYGVFVYEGDPDLTLAMEHYLRIASAEHPSDRK